jgi:hypothetical protein
MGDSCCCPHGAPALSASCARFMGRQGEERADADSSGGRETRGEETRGEERDERGEGRKEEGEGRSRHLSSIHTCVHVCAHERIQLDGRMWTMKNSIRHRCSGTRRSAPSHHKIFDAITTMRKSNVNAGELCIEQGLCTSHSAKRTRHIDCRCRRRTMTRGIGTCSERRARLRYARCNNRGVEEHGERIRMEVILKRALKYRHTCTYTHKATVRRLIPVDADNEECSVVHGSQH